MNRPACRAAATGLLLVATAASAAGPLSEATVIARASSPIAPASGKPVEAGPGWGWLALVGAAGSGLWWLKRGRSLRLRVAGPDAGLSRADSLVLTPQASVHAVRWHGEELLIACTAQQVALLARRPGGDGGE